jgi:4-amino-4-deoxy-L-arabinose transferase-like glycosyltransferase
VFVLLVVLLQQKTRIDVVFLLILVSALVFGLRLAATQEYFGDEEDTWIPLSQTISLSPDQLHLPLRSENHGALPAYVVRISSALFGTTRVGYRLGHLILALVTIVVIFFLTRQWYGPVAARWAAALWALNEYYLSLSARTTAQVPTLLFDTLALYAFSRFLRTQRAAYLYAATTSIALAFYCKENSALVLPVFCLSILHAEYRHWLRSRHLYFACATFFVLIAPDIYVNLTTDPATAEVAFNDLGRNHETYASHLQRIGGISFSPYPSMFYARSAVSSLYTRMTGESLQDQTPEFRSMNAAIGMLLFGAVLVTTLRQTAHDRFARVLLLLFWMVFIFYSLIEPGDPPRRLTAVTWLWVEVTIIPAVILAGARLASLRREWRPPVWAFGAAALAYAVALALG